MFLFERIRLLYNHGTTDVFFFFVRFLEMYGFSKACSGRIQDVAGLARAQLPKDVAMELVNHFNAAHVAGYVGLNAIG